MSKMSGSKSNLSSLKSKFGSCLGLHDASLRDEDENDDSSKNKTPKKDKKKSKSKLNGTILYFVVEFKIFKLS